MKISPKKRYQLLPSTQTQQKAIKGIVNASLLALSSYSSVSATSIQRELQVAFPSQLSNTHQEMKGKRLYQAPSALQDVEIHPHADLSQAPARVRSECVFMLRSPAQGGISPPVPSSLELSPAKVMKNNSVYYNICLRKLNSAPTVGRRHRA